MEGERRPGKLALLVILLLLLVAVLYFVFYYARTRKPVTELPGVDVVARTIPPHFLFSIYGVDAPIGVAVTPRGDRIYVTESGGEREVRAFNREGQELFAFHPPGTQPAIRSPVYITLDDQGRVYVTDRRQHAIYVYSPEGKYLDTILSPQGRLMDWVKAKGGEEYLKPHLSYVYLMGQDQVQVYTPDQQALAPLPRPDYQIWSPLGVSFVDGALYVTDVTKDLHRVMVFDQEGRLKLSFGKKGEGPGEFLYPNAVAIDAQGRMYVTDGNNGRLQIFDAQGQLLYASGRGAGAAAITLPRGAKIDRQNRLYVVDTGGHTILTYDISNQLRFLFSFGTYGLGDGQFSYPNDIALDETGRLYITDRVNNRVQVWSY